MRLICYWRQRRLARYAVLQEPLLLGSPLARHLAHCPECAEAYRDMIRLQQDVLQKLPLPTISPDFDADLMARFADEIRGGAGRQPSQALHTLRPLALGGAVGIAMILGGLVWHTHLQGFRIKPGPEIDRSISPPSYGMASVSDPKKAAPDAMTPTNDPNAMVQIRTKATAAKKGAIPYSRHPDAVAMEVPYWTHRSHRHHGRHHRYGPAAGARYASVERKRTRQQQQGLVRSDLDTSSVLRVTDVKTWGELGQVYEACGDYSRASQAYDHAFAKQPDADLAMAAGETAERTGDTSGALTYLAQILSEESSDAPTLPDEPQEGYEEK